MSSLSKKDRVSLCSFTFSDGRRCRTPRIRNHPHFCFDHAQKEARARTAQEIGKDLAYFFSGDYLSACDLSTALARLLPAVVRGDIKPKTARTIAYLAQTLMQAIHISQDEYINAFGTDGWRKSVRNSVKGNHDYLFPPGPQPQQSESLQPQPQPASAPPSNPPQPAAQPAETPVNCHSERSEESALSSFPAPSPTPPPASQSPASTTDVTYPTPATQPAPSAAPAPQPPQLPADRPIHSATRPKVGPPRNSLRPQLPPPHRRQTFLESTLTQPPITVDSKPLTTILSPLSATLTKNRG
jgi:hypothetical protein